MTLITFFVWLAIAILIAVLPTWASFIYLDELGAMAPGLGYNATNLQNAIIITCITVAALLLARALWLRLRPNGVPMRLGFVVSLLAGTAIALLNGPLFLRPVLPIPPEVSHNLVLGCVIATAAGVALALVRGGHHGSN